MTSGPAACGWSPEIGAGDLHPALIDPWEAAASMGAGAVLAVLTDTTGPAYRNSGAAMVISGDGRAAGAISSGCVEADLILRAQGLQAEGGGVLHLRYGLGSPFFDLKLPCGGGIGVMLFTLRDPAVIGALQQARRARRRVFLRVSARGRLSLHETRPGADPAAGEATACVIGFEPPLRHVIFGAGAEALTFAGLVAGLGQDHLLVSHDPATLASARSQGVRAMPMARLSDIARAGIDARTAVTLFYHDHDYEPEILVHVLASEAFYIGAQGSRATQARRLARLAELDIPPEALARIEGPIGLIHSTRDPQSLAISVLAQITRAETEAALSVC